MAWLEQVGKQAWRVRCRNGDGTTLSLSGFRSRTAAEDFASDMETDRRRGVWLDPSGAATPVVEWTERWVETLDVEPRTEENYRGRLRNHILPQWGSRGLGEITASEVTRWFKQLRRRYAASTVAGIRTVFRMLMADAVDERLIATNPVCWRRRRGRRCDRAVGVREKVWATPEQVLLLARRTAVLGGVSAKLLIITAAWTGCRWGELAGLQRRNVDLRRGLITIDPQYGALHESSRGLWLGPPKTEASARTIKLPKFLIALLREYFAETTGPFVFTSAEGCRLRRSDFNRRVLRPACDGDTRRGLPAVRPGLTFHGLRHSHKTWMIADGIPEIAQAKRLGHHLANRLVETYSHVAAEVEAKLLRGLERRWKHATADRPADTRPPRRKDHARRTPRPRRVGQNGPGSPGDIRDEVSRASDERTVPTVPRAGSWNRPWLPIIAETVLSQTG
jgi:integrase